jgi:hypothetical protein
MYGYVNVGTVHYSRDFDFLHTTGVRLAKVVNVYPYSLRHHQLLHMCKHVYLQKLGSTYG